MLNEEGNLPDSSFNTLFWCSIWRKVSVINCKCKYHTKVVGFQKIKRGGQNPLPRCPCSQYILPIFLSTNKKRDCINTLNQSLYNSLEKKIMNDKHIRSSIHLTGIELVNHSAQFDHPLLTLLQEHLIRKIKAHSAQMSPRNPKSMQHQTFRISITIGNITVHITILQNWLEITTYFWNPLTRFLLKDKFYPL